MVLYGTVTVLVAASAMFDQQYASQLLWVKGVRPDYIVYVSQVSRMW